jgi:hypothetical protein
MKEFSAEFRQLHFGVFLFRHGKNRFGVISGVTVIRVCQENHY